MLRDLAVMRGAGMMVTTPNVVRLTADVVLLIGAGLLDAWPELPERLLAPLAPRPLKRAWRAASSGCARGRPGEVRRSNRRR